MIRKILIANRGEIAIRVMRSCREMGIRTVALFSEADRMSPHVLYADEAWPLKGNLSSESYLDIHQVMDILIRSGADAVHPGYGFLSENTRFAAEVEKAGKCFIGPDAEAIGIMGDKTAARQAVSARNVPLVPGSAVLSSSGDAVPEAERIGYPVLVKAAGGGGGKGMHRVDSPEQLQAAVEKAGREAAAAFGDGRIYLEKYIENPHHIEFQILADTRGTIIHLNERECSIQRRFQKVIEESPSPLLTPELRKSMGDAAVEVARSCHYTGAGTVEFLADESGHFYFLEMNTRLQVEHPVTEMLTGIDLVREQIRIADGHPLAHSQDGIRQLGHAMECRIYAEDSGNNFMPSTGTVSWCRIPDGPGIRFDGALQPGLVVSPYYDPMIGKLICWGNDRPEVLARMQRALDEFVIFGVQTSIPFCSSVISHPDFQNGHYSTHFIDENRAALSGNGVDTGLSQAAGLAALHHFIDTQKKRKPEPQRDIKERNSGWKNRKYPS